MVLRSTPIHLSESSEAPDSSEISHATKQWESFTDHKYFAATEPFEPVKSPRQPAQLEQVARELLLMRHAKSAWGTAAKRDYDRPLAGRGKHDAPRIGRWLRNQRLLPDYVVSSPAKRTKQTTELVCAKLGIDAAQVAWEPKLYNAGLVEVLEVLATCPVTANRVMLVGHHTGLQPLLKFLYGPSLEKPNRVKLFPTAAVAHMGIGVDWDRLYSGVAHGFRITRPRSLSSEPEAGGRHSRKQRRKANRKTENQAA